MISSPQTPSGAASDSQDQDRRLQLIRRLKLRLDEIFQHPPPPVVSDPTAGLAVFAGYSLSLNSDMWDALSSLCSLMGELLVIDALHCTHTLTLSLSISY